MAAVRRTDVDAVALAHIQHGDLDPGGLSRKEDQAEEGAGDIAGDPGKPSGREEEDEQAGIEKKDLPQLRRAGTKQADAPGGTQTAERLVQEKDSLYGKRGGSEKRQPFPAGGKKQPAQGGQKDTASQKRSHERDHYQIDGDGKHVPFIEGRKNQRKRDHADAEAGTKARRKGFRKTDPERPKLFSGTARPVSLNRSAGVPLQKPVL